MALFIRDAEVDALAEEVRQLTHVKTKTEAVETALKEMARRHKMKELFSMDLGLTPEEWKTAFDPASYPEDKPTLRVAEDQKPYNHGSPA